MISEKIRGWCTRTRWRVDTACKSGPAHGQMVIVADTRRDQCADEGAGTILKATRHHVKSVAIKRTNDVASFTTRTPGKFLKSYPEWRRPNTQPFPRRQASIDVGSSGNVVTISGQHLIETRDSGCQTHELSGVPVKISTTRKCCDKVPAPSGRFLTQNL